MMRRLTVQRGTKEVIISWMDEHSSGSIFVSPTEARDMARLLSNEAYVLDPDNCSLLVPIKED